MKLKTTYKYENGKLYVGTRPPMVTKDIGPCFYCKQPVRASSGQAIQHLNNQPTHKICRKSGGKLNPLTS